MATNLRRRLGATLIKFGERLSSVEPEATIKAGTDTGSPTAAPPLFMCATMAYAFPQPQRRMTHSINIMSFHPSPEEKSGARYSNASTASEEDDVETKRAQVRQLIKQALEAPTPDELVGFHNFTVRLRRLSVWNARMAYIHRPGAASLATEAEWKKINRYVLPDAVPILILWPFGPIRYVYEIADTGPPIDRNEINDPFATKGQLNKAALDKLEQRLKKQKHFHIEVELRRQDFYRAGSASPQGSLALPDLPANPLASDTSFAAFAAKNAIVKELPGARPNYRVLLNDRLTYEEQFVTLCHELGHIFCGHLGACATKATGDDSGWPDRRRLSTSVAEIEAEAVAYQVAARAGVTPRSAEYLKSYVAAVNVAKVDVDMVARAASRIERLAGLTYAQTKPTHPRLNTAAHPSQDNGSSTESNLKTGLGRLKALSASAPNSAIRDQYAKMAEALQILLKAKRAGHLREITPPTLAHHSASQSPTHRVT